MIFEANGTDEVYCDLKDEINLRCQEAKKRVEELWGKVHNYIDPDVLAELPIQFHQRFWEIYLAASLVEVGLNLEQSSGRDGPDICIKGAQSKVWVEAITASRGDGDDAVQKPEFGVVSEEDEDVPDNQIKLRLLNAFAAKSCQYKKHRKKNWVSAEEPYIIAINAAQVPSARKESEIPRIVRSLLPFGHQVLRLDAKTLELVDTSHEYQGVVSKASGTEIETTSFLNAEYSGISAIIYSCADVFNHPVKISESLLLFHNPLALNPIPLDFLKSGHEYWIDSHLLRNKNWNQENNHEMYGS